MRFGDDECALLGIGTGAEGVPHDRGVVAAARGFEVREVRGVVDVAEGVGIPIAVMRLWRDFSPNVIKIMVWCGVRGGISVALALSLPPGAERDVFVAMTYVIVVFSIIGQGLTVAPVVRRLGRAAR